MYLCILIIFKSWCTLLCQHYFEWMILWIDLFFFHFTYLFMDNNKLFSAVFTLLHSNLVACILFFSFFFQIIFFLFNGYLSRLYLYWLDRTMKKKIVLYFSSWIFPGLNINQKSMKFKLVFLSVFLPFCKPFFFVNCKGKMFLMNW